MSDKSTKTRRKGAGKKRAKASKPSVVIEMERAYKKFHAAIDDAMRRAYKCHPSCQGFERCQWRERFFHVLDLDQAIKNVTQVVKKFCSVSRQRGKRQTEIVRKALQITSENKGRTIRQILKAEHPDWDKSKLDEEVPKLRASSRQARLRDKARSKKKGE